MTAPSTMRDALNHYLNTQPWWKRNANTVTAAWTGLAAFGGIMLANDTGLPDWAVYAIGGLLYAGQVVGIAKTPNGITPTVVDKVEGAVEAHYGRHAAR